MEDGGFSDTDFWDNLSIQNGMGSRNVHIWAEIFNNIGNEPTERHVRASFVWWQKPIFGRTEMMEKLKHSAASIARKQINWRVETSLACDRSFFLEFSVSTIPLIRITMFFVCETTSPSTWNWNRTQHFTRHLITYNSAKRTFPSAHLWEVRVGTEINPEWTSPLPRWRIYALRLNLITISVHSVDLLPELRNLNANESILIYDRKMRCGFSTKATHPSQCINNLHTFGIISMSFPIWCAISSFNDRFMER